MRCAGVIESSPMCHPRPGSPLGPRPESITGQREFRARGPCPLSVRSVGSGPRARLSAEEPPAIHHGTHRGLAVRHVLADRHVHMHHGEDDHDHMATPCHRRTVMDSPSATNTQRQAVPQRVDAHLLRVQREAREQQHDQRSRNMVNMANCASGCGRCTPWLAMNRYRPPRRRPPSTIRCSRTGCRRSARVMAATTNAYRRSTNATPGSSRREMHEADVAEQEVSRRLPAIEGRRAMKYPVIASATMHSAVTQCQMRMPAVYTYTAGNYSGGRMIARRSGRPARVPRRRRREIFFAHDVPPQRT